MVNQPSFKGDCSYLAFIIFSLKNSYSDFGLIRLYDDVTQELQPPHISQDGPLHAVGLICRLTTQSIKEMNVWFPKNKRQRSNNGKDRSS